MLYDIIKNSTEFSRDFEVDPKLAEGVQSLVLLNKTIDFLNEEVSETKDAIAENDLAPDNHSFFSIYCDQNRNNNL